MSKISEEEQKKPNVVKLNLETVILIENKLSRIALNVKQIR